MPGAKATSTFEIHVFTDALKAGFCAVAYLVEISTEQRVSLLMSRTRLATLKLPLTIPRLEISAVNLGSKLLKHFRSNLDISMEKVLILSESNVALENRIYRSIKENGVSKKF